MLCVKLLEVVTTRVKVTLIRRRVGDSKSPLKWISTRHHRWRRSNNGEPTGVDLFDSPQTFRQSSPGRFIVCGTPGDEDSRRHIRAAGQRSSRSLVGVPGLISCSPALTWPRSCGRFGYRVALDRIGRSSPEWETARRT